MQDCEIQTVQMRTPKILTNYNIAMALHGSACAPWF